MLSCIFQKEASLASGELGRAVGQPARELLP